MLRKSSAFLRLALLSQLLWSTLSLGQGTPRYYDEIFDGEGTIRPQYVEAYALYQNLNPQQLETFRRRTLADFQGDNALSPLPRLLLESEYEVLRRGTEQRAKALVAFLKDHYSGEKSYLDGNVIPEDVLQRILLRAQEFGFAGQVDPANIAFNYGPDIIRDADGVWRVIEDNPGYIGGPGDLIRAREILMARSPKLKLQLDIRDNPQRFFMRLVNHYRSRMSPKDGALVMLSLSPSRVSDNEDKRLQAIMESYGVVSVTPDDRRIVVENGQTFLKMPDGSRKPIGYLVINGEHLDFDPKSLLYQQKALVAELKAHIYDYDIMIASDPPSDPADRSTWRYGRDFRKSDLSRARNKLIRFVQDIESNPEADLEAIRTKATNISHIAFSPTTGYGNQIRGLNEVIASGKLRSNYTPGVDFIGDKEFYLYVEKMVEFYLGQKPILRNIETRHLHKEGPNGSSVLDEQGWEKIKNRISEYVIKGVDGRGGDAVWIGRKMDAEAIATLEETLRANPGRFIAQAFTHLSVQAGNIVDLRMITAVDNYKVIVSETPWGRAVSLQGNGKVNISDHGAESAVVVVADPASNCQVIATRRRRTGMR